MPAWPDRYLPVRTVASLYRWPPLPLSPPPLSPLRLSPLRLSPLRLSPLRLSPLRLSPLRLSHLFLVHLLRLPLPWRHPAARHVSNRLRRIHSRLPRTRRRQGVRHPAEDPGGAQTGGQGRAEQSREKVRAGADTIKRIPTRQQTSFWVLPELRCYL
jgi:hypothetical protein